MLRQISFTKQAVIGLVLIAAAAALWFAYVAVSGAAGSGEGRDNARSRGGGRPVPVIVAPVRLAADDLLLEAVGTGRANRSIMLRAETSGRVASMPLAAGVRFKAGDVLLRIEDTEERLAVDLAKTRLEDARRTRDRLERLRGRGAASASTLDDARTAYAIANIELQRAEEVLNDHVIRAPFAGVAGIPEIEEGAWVDSDVAIASYDDRSTIQVEFDLPEALLARVPVGLAVTATTPAVPDRRFEGQVATVDTRITANSRSVRVRVALPNPDDLLRPGASFAVRLELPGATYPLVPELALQFARGSLQVWRVADGAAENVPVRMIRRRQGAVLVEGPLAEGDRLVIEGAQRLTPGRKVKILDGGDGGTS